MRLKQLTLTGYKTFANKTQFVFDQGITAIIGPNGSGKSNVADAIRWALGEQSAHLLRSKKTEDMIFAGSSKRARAGMSEVLLTFDNSDHYFPIEFSEVAIGRRAYRDGQNEYVLNGNRVRLRDISDLLGHTGLAERTYTVIGQGLVDSALAQKPEERRTLFEEAAGVGVYRDRRDDALKRLIETRDNLQRARDILSEISPRVKQLERQAERVRQFHKYFGELQSQSRIWFGYHYHTLNGLIVKTKNAYQQAEQKTRDAQTEVERFEAQIAEMRAEQAGVRAELGKLLPKLEEARKSLELRTREMAVQQERRANLNAQVVNLNYDLEERQQHIGLLAQRILAAEAAVLQAQTHLLQRQQALDAAQKLAAEYRTARANLEQKRTAAQQDVMRVNAAVSSAQQRLNLIRLRQNALKTQLTDVDTRHRRNTEQKAAELAALMRVDQMIASEVARGQHLSQQAEQAQKAAESARQQLSVAQSNFAATEAEVNMIARMTTFVELRLQGVDQGDLSSQAKSAKLPGFRGVLASLIQIKPDDERAVKAAIGDHLNAVVFEAFDNITHTQAWLARVNQNNGRLTILPLDRVTEVAQKSVPTNEIEVMIRDQRVRRISDVISAPAWLKPCMSVIAGRAFLCRNFEQAIALANQLPADCVCVTRDGELVRAKGTLTLASGLRMAKVLGEDTDAFDAQNALDGMLDLEKAKTNLAAMRQERDTVQHALATAQTAIDNVIRARAQFERDIAAHHQQREEIARRLARLDDQQPQFDNDKQRIEHELHELNVQTENVLAELKIDEKNHADVMMKLTAIEAQLREQAENSLQLAIFESQEMQADALPAQPKRGWMDELNATTADVASAVEMLRNANQTHRDRSHELTLARSQLEQRRQRLNEANAQLLMATQESERLQLQAHNIRSQLDGFESDIKPLQASLSQFDQHIFELDTQRRNADKALREVTAQFNHIALELSRYEDEMKSLRERAIDALGDGVMGEGDITKMDAAPPELANDAPTTNPLLDTLPEVAHLPEGIELRMSQLRSQIKRLGALNFEAQQEFEALDQRHRFISEQADDLDKAVASLQHIVNELNDVMKVNFRETFDKIAAHFQETFKILFGGGQAELKLTAEGNLDESGVEIYAQPPGKRPQSLSLLSGGERSLTAAALLFAILRVRPTPFCVLDEMDAALDEANVGRFGVMLESLSEKTQFIVITHNRRTVECANTIYGVSMGADGVSITLSLRLDEANERLKKS
jgi:chromosome segregation protein